MVLLFANHPNLEAIQMLIATGFPQAAMAFI